MVVGDVRWQPKGGQIGGAILLDGIDDFITTSPLLNPAEASFSVFAWVKGGMPGQTIISQEEGADWLRSDPQGNLMTSLTSGGRRVGAPLISTVAISDDHWHRVGLTWDGADRVLYVDDVEVARDTLSALKSSDGSLNIGVGNGFEAGTFWSGLIDDVKIYDRVVEP